jgi:indolepyruvate ferredoxin oxidoreductase beta subunit
MSATRAFDTTNILVVGTGGQGVMTATEILAEAAIALGHDVKKTEVAGMAQRGGVVSSHLRFGAKVLSPQITPGSADVLLGFEAAEAMRWRHMLRPDGLVLMNTGRLVPPVVELGLYDYPDDPVAAMRAAGTRVFSFDASTIAQELGDIRLGNTVMLGAIRPPALPRRSPRTLHSQAFCQQESRTRRTQPASLRRRSGGRRTGARERPKLPSPARFALESRPSAWHR